MLRLDALFTCPFCLLLSLCPLLGGGGSIFFREEGTAGLGGCLLLKTLLALSLSLSLLGKLGLAFNVLSVCDFLGGYGAFGLGYSATYY